MEGEWPRRAMKWQAVLLGLGGWVGKRKGELDPVSEKRFNIRIGEEYRLTLAW